MASKKLEQKIKFSDFNYGKTFFQLLKEDIRDFPKYIKAKAYNLFCDLLFSLKQGAKILTQ